MISLSLGLFFLRFLLHFPSCHIPPSFHSSQFLASSSIRYSHLIKCELSQWDSRVAVTRSGTKISIFPTIHSSQLHSGGEIMFCLPLLSSPSSGCAGRAGGSDLQRSFPGSRALSAGLEHLAAPSWISFSACHGLLPPQLLPGGSLPAVRLLRGWKCAPLAKPLVVVPVSLSLPALPSSRFRKIPHLSS